MDSNQLWKKRTVEFYIIIAKYFSTIAGNVFFSLLLLGCVFVYYYLKVIQWIPSYILTEWIASLMTAAFFLRSSVRTFVQKADLVFLLPAEASLSDYFRKAMIYSAILDVVKFTIVITFMTVLINAEKVLTSPFFVLFLCMIVLNVRLTWVEQWLTMEPRRFLHKLIRFLSFTMILFFLFIGNWIIALTLLLVNYGFSIYVFPLDAKSVNWEYLLKQEEKSLLRIYKFINIYTDVHHVKRSFRRRRFLTWIIKRLTSHDQPSSFVYLYALLFVRYNDFYFLYIRLSLIGIVSVCMYPEYGWIVIPVILFLTGYQILPLQHELNEVVMLYPVSYQVKKKSLLQLLSILLIIQLLVMNVLIYIFTNSNNIIFGFSLELVFVYWFVQVFAAKRIV